MVLPSDFTSLMCSQLGEVQAAALCDALCTTEPSVSVRLNPFKKADNGVNSTLPTLHSPLNKIPWCPDAYYLPDRPPFTFDPLFHAGAYYVQDASSMFLAQVLREGLSATTQSAPIVLDLCAAPGGKSTLLRSLLPEDALLVSNEPIGKRVQVLAENMTKWGHPAVVVTQNYPADFSAFPSIFDVIVADVPCSGEGMFRKDEEAVSEWSLQNVERCSQRQRDILADVWPALKPGGLLVYSTCTFNRMEDEENVLWAARNLGADIQPVSCSPEWGITEGQPGLHFFPHLVHGEGFYIALLRKHDGDVVSPAKAHQEKKKKLPSLAEAAEMGSWLEGDFTLSVREDRCTAFPSSHASLLPMFRQHLRVLTEGILLAELKGHDWQPAHALAMSTALRREAFPQAELTYEQALAYLRRESININAPRGIVLVTFCGLPLGFVKNLGSRANNLYPQEWRIRSTHTTPFA